MPAILKLAKYGAHVTVRNIHDETPFGMYYHPDISSISSVCVTIAMSDSPEIRQLLVDLQSGMDPDQLEEAMSKKDDDEAATHNRKTRRLEHIQSCRKLFRIWGAI